jgi:hypothetical protein
MTTLIVPFANTFALIMSRPTSIGVGTGEPVHSLENRMNSEIIKRLTQPLEYEWSVQGLGMMRTYLSKTKRLHIWHSSLIVTGATELHDHPWNFESEVMFGCVRQMRFEDNDSGRKFMKQRILCGEGGGIIGEAVVDPEEVQIFSNGIETYFQGATYGQKAHEIHRSFPSNNTVTVVTRDFLKDRDHAHVYYPVGGGFVSAIPRPASHAEILFITRSVLHAYQEAEPEQLDPASNWSYTPNIFEKY